MDKIGHVTSDTSPPFSCSVESWVGPGRRLESYTVMTLVLLSSVEIKKGQLPLQLITHKINTHIHTISNNIIAQCKLNTAQYYYVQNIVKFSITLWGWLIVGGSCVLYRYMVLVLWN